MPKASSSRRAQRAARRDAGLRQADRRAQRRTSVKKGDVILVCRRSRARSAQIAQHAGEGAERPRSRCSQSRVTNQAHARRSISKRSNDERSISRSCSAAERAHRACADRRRADRAGARQDAVLGHFYQKGDEICRGREHRQAARPRRARAARRAARGRTSADDAGTIRRSGSTEVRLIGRLDQIMHADQL